MCAQADGVVLGVNGDPAASPALRFAVREAQRRSLPLTLVRSWQVSPLYEAALLMTRGELERAAVQTLQAATDAVAKLAPELRTVSRLAPGRTDELLIEASRRATLLVLGRRGGRGPWLGPVLAHVSAGAHCPVIVVPDEAPVPSHQAPGSAGWLPARHPRPGSHPRLRSAPPVRGAGWLPRDLSGRRGAREREPGRTTRGATALRARCRPPGAGHPRSERLDATLSRVGEQQPAARRTVPRGRDTHDPTMSRRRSRRRDDAGCAGSLRGPAAGATPLKYTAAMQPHPDLPPLS